MNLLLAAVLYFVQPCVPWGSLCVQPYVVEYLPPQPERNVPGASWGPLVAKYWPPELVPWALRIIECESRGDPWADNPTSTAAGLFQFLRSTWDNGPAPALGLPSYDSGAPYVPEWNIQAAAWLYENWGGASQWECKASR